MWDYSMGCEGLQMHPLVHTTNPESLYSQSLKPGSLGKATQQ